MILEKTFKGRFIIYPRYLIYINKILTEASFICKYNAFGKESICLYSSTLAELLKYINLSVNNIIAIELNAYVEGTKDTTLVIFEQGKLSIKSNIHCYSADHFFKIESLLKESRSFSLYSTIAFFSLFLSSVYLGVTSIFWFVTVVLFVGLCLLYSLTFFSIPQTVFLIGEEKYRYQRFEKRRNNIFYSVILVLFFEALRFFFVRS